jgi:hypothetical protein
MRNDDWKAALLEQRAHAFEAWREPSAELRVPPLVHLWRHHISLGTLRDWERGRAEPDQAAHAYLKVIAREPDLVHKAALAWVSDFSGSPTSGGSLLTVWGHELASSDQGAPPPCE